MLCAGRHLNDGFSFQSRDFDFSTEHGRDEIDRHITGDIEALAMKDWMGPDGNGPNGGPPGDLYLTVDVLPGIGVGPVGLIRVD